MKKTQLTLLAALSIGPPLWVQAGTPTPAPTSSSTAAASTHAAITTAAITPATTTTSATTTAAATTAAATPATTTTPAATPGATDHEATISIRDFSFAPVSITIAPGTTVHWKNLDGEPHTVRSIDTSFRSDALDQNDSFTFKFDKPGTYRYACSIHPQMIGTIVVKNP